NPGEGEMHALERPTHPRAQPSGRMLERIDQLLRAVVAFPPLADAAIDDLLQMIAAGKRANVISADPRARVAAHEHAGQLAHLIDIIARLPFRRGAIENFTRRRQTIHGAGDDAAAVALLAHDAEVAEL